MPKFVIFAGVNGAGKTTLYLSNPKLQNLPRVNVDEIVRDIGRWDNPQDVFKAGKIAVAKIKEYMAANKSFNQETTLCGGSIIKNIINAKQQGYVIELYYVGLDNEDLAVQRVNERVKNGGHGIPEADIRKRYNRSFGQLKKVIPYCDRIELYDNTIVFKSVAIYENRSWDITDKNIPDWCKKIIE